MSAIPNSMEAYQRWMFEALVAPRAAGRAQVDAMLLPGAHIDATAALAIYQRSYILRLRKCLEEQFPATCHALGEGLFCDFADEYLRSCPSDSYTLYELGRRFPAWLEENRPDRDAAPGARESWIDFMVDLASYERALFHLFDAPGPEGKALPSPETSDDALMLEPSLVLASYRFPVAWYYHEVRAGKTPPVPTSTPQAVAIVRRDFQTTTYPVSALHFRFLTLVRELAGIPPALEAVADWTGRPLDAVQQSWLREVRAPWITAGFFAHSGASDSAR
jgi:hypothetical protein